MLCPTHTQNRESNKSYDNLLSNVQTYCSLGCYIVARWVKMIPITEHFKNKTYLYENYVYERCSLYGFCSSGTHGYVIVVVLHRVIYWSHEDIYRWFMDFKCSLLNCVFFLYIKFDGYVYEKRTFSSYLSDKSCNLISLWNFYFRALWLEVRTNRFCFHFTNFIAIK